MGRTAVKGREIGTNDESTMPARPSATPAFDDLAAIVADDAREVARRTLRGKFGRLANFAILARVKAAAGGRLRDLSDVELLERWFLAYDRAIVELRGSR